MPGMMEQPVKEVETFYLACHLFSLSKTFNIVVGLSQVIGAVLIVINRTAIIGSLFLLPILVNILLIDTAFTMQMFGPALVMRLSGMTAADVVILYPYRKKLITAWSFLTVGLSVPMKYPWWIYLLLPLMGFLTDVVIAVFMMPIKWLFI